MRAVSFLHIYRQENVSNVLFHVRYAYIRAYFKLFLVKLLNFLFICAILTWIRAQARLFGVHFYIFYNEVPVSHKIAF